MTQLTAGDLIVARYEVTDAVASPLSNSSHAEMWRAQDKIFSRKVNVYVIDDAIPHGALERARATAQIHSDVIARVIDVIDKGATQRFVVTEAPEGVDTATAISQAPFTAAQATAVIGKVASALVRAQEKGLYHGGLTADSLLFGEQSVQITGLVPRNVLGLNLDRTDAELALCDARGLAALTYFMLTGLMSNYTAEDDAHLPSLSKIVEGVTPELNALTTDVLNGSNTEIDSAQAFLDALGPWSPDDLPSVTPAPVPLVISDDPPAAIPPVPVPPQRMSARANGSPTTPPSSQPAAIPVPGLGAAASAVGAAAVGSGAVGAADAVSAAGTAATSAAGAAGMPNSVAAAASAPAGTPPRFIPTASSAPRPVFDQVGPLPAREFGMQPQTRKSGFNPTWFIMLFFLALVVLGLFWAFKTLTAPTEPAIVAPSGRPTDSQSTEPGKDGTGSGTAQEPSQEPTQEVVKPEVSSAQSLDPQGDNNEHPELQDRLVDGDTTNVWYSRTYKAADFSGFTRDGIGVAVKLKKVATVNSVLVSSGNTGGHLEIRAASAEEPTKGKVLASGELNGDTLFKFDSPVQTDSITIWWTELPKDGDGKNRAYIYEIGIG